MADPKKYVEKIRQEIESSRSTRLWEDSIHMLDTISESVFSRAAHFILELLQNAEDAGVKVSSQGEIDFCVAPDSITVSHNGAPFTEEDVNSICGVRSKKKPEQGTLGFLGIGFKSVFRVTDCPQIHSGDFHFKFDKTAWTNPSDEPWQITPLWIDALPDGMDKSLTSFILPFRSTEAYEQTLQELQKLDVHVFLFLKWLKKLCVRDQVSGETTTIENLGGQGNIIELRKNATTHRFVIFRRASPVPPLVAADPSLEFYKRQNVKQREVVLAFGLDDQDNLKPIEDASALGSVSSFLPLVEERSGAKFLVQSDFLVQPGREAIQYELPWNHWLVSESAAAAKAAIDEFKQHPRWRSQFLPIFDYQAYWGQAAFEQLFSPKLHVPLTEYLKQSAVLLTRSGGHVKPADGVIAEAGAEGLLEDSDLPMLFYGRTDLRIVHQELDVDSIPSSIRQSIRSVSLGQIARCKALLEAKLKERSFVRWFVNLYKSMAQTDQYFRTEVGRTSRGRYSSYNSPIYVLTDQNTIALADQVYLRDIPSDVLQLRKKFKEIDSLLASYQLIHPRLSTPELVKFFTDRTHVRAIDYDKVCRDVFLPQLRLSSQAPPKGELIAYTRLIQKGPPPSEHIWIMTKGGIAKPSNQVFFGTSYSPSEDWELNARYCPQLDFISEDYIKGVAQAEVGAWKEFFMKIGVRDRADSPYVEDFAMAYVEDRLHQELTNFIPKNRQQHGYDREATRVSDGVVVKLEIKGQKNEHVVELSGNEPVAAQQAKQNNLPFWVCVVPGIPENPRLWVVEDALAAGVSNIVTIDISKWKASGRRVV